MIDQRRLNEELRRLRELIRSDPQVLARVDRNGDGNIDGEEWDRARRCIIRRLEVESDAATPAGNAAAGKLAHKVFEQELRRPEPIENPRRMDECDHLILEWPIRLRARFGNPQLMYTIRSGDNRLELGKFEQLTTFREAARQRRDGLDHVGLHYSIRPAEGDHVRLRRRPTFLGEELEVCSTFGRTIAHVKPKVRVLEYGYGVQGEDGGSLRVERRPWNERCEQGYRRTGGERKRPRSRQLPHPYHLLEDRDRWAGFMDSEIYFPDPENPKECYRQWVIRLEPGHLTPPLRWGLIGTLAFILHRPSLLRGWVWSLLGT